VSWYADTEIIMPMLNAHIGQNLFVMEMTSMNKPEIEQKIISVLNDMTQDWELDSDDGIGPDTGLMNDLEFESIDVVQFAVALEQNFNQKGMPFEQLFMQDGDYVDEIKVSQVADFIDATINK
jgi:acyl carrier protein